MGLSQCISKSSCGCVEVPESQIIKANNGIPVYKQSQLYRSACKVDAPGNQGSGFFLLMPFHGKLLKTFMTNNHVIDENMVNNSVEFKILYDNLSKSVKISANKKQRQIFTFKKEDVTVIEIKKEDKIPDDLFLEADPDCVKKGLKKYIGECIEVFGFPKNSNQLQSSTGNIKRKYKDTYTFLHDAGTDKGSSGSPIELKSNLKIIGIHKAGAENEVDNFGVFIGDIVKKINREIIRQSTIQSTKSIPQEIDLIFDVKEECKDVYCIGHDYEDASGKLHEYYRYLEKAQMILDGNNVENTKKMKLNKGKHVLKYQFDFNLKACDGLFAHCEDITKVKFTNCDTSNVNNMYRMFYWCEKLINIEGVFNTANVKNMRGMFSGCKSLCSLNLSSFNTANVKNMGAMFNGCLSLTSLNLSSFNTANVKDMEEMFIYCSSLSSLDLSSFDTANVKDMQRMFCHCESLKSLDLSSFSTANVEDMNGMFGYCKSLSSLDLSSFDTAVEDMGGMFNGCLSLKEVKLSKNGSDEIKNQLDNNIKIKY